MKYMTKMNKFAGVILIGDELLSGRTQDSNLVQIADFSNQIGIQIAEARIIADSERDIMDSVTMFSKQYDYVFTTGGIGPTHDDITASAIAKAFDRPLIRDSEAVEMIKKRFAYHRPNEPIGEARLKMADIPQGARLIKNAVSGAPGFQIENVFVLAGVPLICASMLEALTDQIEGGEKWISHSVKGALAEGDIAQQLSTIQRECGGVKIGSYPSFGEDGMCLRIVLRAPQSAYQSHQTAIEQVRMLMKERGVQPIDETH